jgi:hypothetical protein
LLSSSFDEIAFAPAYDDDDDAICRVKEMGVTKLETTGNV